MFNIADIVVVVMILIATFMGYKRGFIRTGFGVLSFFIAIAITFMFYKPVMGLIKERTGVEEWLYEYLYSLEFKEESAEIESGDEYIDNLPQTIIDVIGLEEAKQNAKNVIVQKIVDFVVKLLAIIIVYIVAKVVLAIAVFVLDSIFSLPVLKQFNEILGLLLGIVLGFVQVYFLSAIIALIGAMPACQGIAEVINGSLFAHVLYNNNLLLQILF